MKKMTYLYVLLVLSFLNTAGRVWETFFAKVPTKETFGNTGDAELDKLLADSLKMEEEMHIFNTNLIHKLIVLVMVALLVAALVFALELSN